MKTLLTILFAISSAFLFAQTIFTVDNFSKDYYGKIQIEDTAEVTSKGWVAIYERNTNKELVKVTSQELYLSLHDGKALANIKSLPYGEQSLIMYEDYNFEGKNDLAICDGQNSCYHGPSFQIYLASKNGFILSNEFTKLAQENCGMFDTDSAAKKIYTMTKDGCCYHEFAEYIVENNKPKVIKINTESQTMPFSTSTEEIWNGKKMVATSATTIDTNMEGIEVILSFTVPRNKKKIILFNINDRMLYYALLDKDENVEFSYPLESVYQSHDFTFSPLTNNKSVTFRNKNAVYKVYEQKDKVGIVISVDGKTYDWTGNVTTKKGSLVRLQKVHLDNVY